MNILIVTAHPSQTGLTHAIAETYKEAKQAKGHTVELVNLYAKEFSTEDLHFETLKDYKSTKIQKKFQNQLVWAHEIVVVHPIWWGTPPSVMKRWVELSFWHGIAYRYTGPGKWLKLFDGKIAKVFATSGGPSWIYRLPLYPFRPFWKNSVFEYCGIDVIDIQICGNLNILEGKEKEKHVQKFLKKIKRSA